MKRPAYALIVVTAVVTGGLAVLCSILLGERIRDPDGFLGPGWVRLPAMVVGAFLADIVPRAVWRSRGRPHAMRVHALAIYHEHWTPERVKLVLIGLTSFYVTYVGYRNLKNYLPDFYDNTYDRALNSLDRFLMFGNEPGTVFQDLLGTGVSAHVLAFIYVLYLPLAPLSLVAWLVWSKNINYGYWYATANCLTWAFGTLSYYILPTLGPNFEYPWLYEDLPTTGVTALQEGLWFNRQGARFPLNPFSESISSVAGFASLHTALTLVIAMMLMWTVRNRTLTIAGWIFFVLTVVSTIYFGWHYIADDLAGIVIALLSVYLAGWATGHRFDRRGRFLGQVSSHRDAPTVAKVEASAASG